MSTHHQHRRDLERELENAGCKPQVIRTEGGHMRITFEAGGKRQMILTSWTPSDHRATLNARARIRKILREHPPLPSEQVKPPGLLSKALALPTPAEPLGERIARLETDVAVLLDMLASVAASVGMQLDDPEIEILPQQPVAAAAAPAVVEAVVPPAPEPVVRTRKHGTESKVHELMLSLEYAWVPIQEIIRREPHRSRGAISVALNSLKKKGLVENGARGMWRKVRAQRKGVNGAYRNTEARTR